MKYTIKNKDLHVEIDTTSKTINYICEEHLQRQTMERIWEIIKGKFDYTFITEYKILELMFVTNPNYEIGFKIKGEKNAS